MIYISYVTNNTPYIKVIEKYLLPSLHKFKKEYDIEYIGDLGSWQKNTHYKAIFIKRMLMKHKQPVIFLDADAQIQREPKLFTMLEKIETKVDVAFHKLDWAKFWHNKEGNPRRDYLSGTMYFNYNIKVINFLDKWIKYNENSIAWEQKNMQVILEALSKEGKINIYDLPIQYTTIRKKDGTIPSYIKDPVIVHFQKSREYKNWWKTRKINE